VPYKHPSGAVIWVTLSHDVALALTRPIRRSSVRRRSHRRWNPTGVRSGWSVGEGCIIRRRCFSLIVRTPTAARPGDRDPTWSVEPRSPRSAGSIFFARCGLAAKRAPESGRPDLVVWGRR